MEPPRRNVALIGVQGRGLAHYDSIAEENVFALCDINEAHILRCSPVRVGPPPKLTEENAFDHKGLDTAGICTADQTHALIANCPQCDHHCYCEKPLATTVNKARTVIHANRLSTFHHSKVKEA